jgi:aryl-alcohol dehydrogenase-like predicted oxidoreductase
VIGFYWYHRPDGQTPIAVTLETLDELVRSGTVRAIGAIAGLLSLPGGRVGVAGATKPEQVRANVAAARWTPSADDLAALRGLLSS